MGRPFRHPVVPFSVSPNNSATELMKRMAGTAFQARNLSQGVDIWLEMLRKGATIFFGLAGAMVPAGMREVMVYLIENRYIDCLVSTGANLFHDLHESLGHFHWQGDTHSDDKELARSRINRIYDVFAEEEEFLQTDGYISDFSSSLDQSHAYSTREYLSLLGERLCQDGARKGILTSAAKAKVPIYCPALADSSFGIALAAGRARGKNHLYFDIVRDVIEITQIVVSAPATGVIYIGGGTPKNFIQQAQVSAHILGQELGGHRYAIQITTDSPQWGGLSGCTFEEAQSWRKVSPRAKTVTINIDATIALPLLVSALAESGPEVAKGRAKPSFTLGGELLSLPNMPTL